MPFFVLVLGSHRSGSSVTTKILQSLGCNLGPDLLAGDAFSNVMGHFENLSVLKFNEELLVNLGTDWRNPIPLDQNAFYKSKRIQIENDICSLLQDLLAQKINAIKDPRIPILLELWEGAILRTISNLKIIITIRHPGEVASSLQKRDNLSDIVGVQLWVQATLNAIKFARDYSNYFVFYDHLISDPLGTTKGIEEYLHSFDNSANLSTLAAEDVVPGYRHNKVLDGEFTVLNVASEMYEHISKFQTATPLIFPDELLDKWQKRIELTYKEVNRLELIRATDLQRDRVVEDLWESSRAAVLKLSLERDEIVVDRDRITQHLTSERDQIASEKDQMGIERDQIKIDSDRITLELISERDQLSLERELLLNSTIWKATKPLRSLIELFKRILPH